MIYFTMISVAKVIQLRLIKQLFKKDLEKISNEAVMTLFVIRVFARWAEENH
jgi:hypothetical protein